MRMWLWLWRCEQSCQFMHQQSCGASILRPGSFTAGHSSSLMSRRAHSSLTTHAPVRYLLGRSYVGPTVEWSDHPATLPASTTFSYRQSPQSLPTSHVLAAQINRSIAWHPLLYSEFRRRDTVFSAFCPAALPSPSLRRPHVSPLHPLTAPTPCAVSCTRSYPSLQHQQ